MATNKLQWKRIAKGEKLPCTAMLMKEDGTISTVATCAGVVVGQDAYYLSVEELRSFPKEESEDERIRKSIIELLNEVHFTFKYYDINKMLAWLEKHKYTEDDLDKAYKCADEVQYRRGYEDAKKEIEKRCEQKPNPCENCGIATNNCQKFPCTIKRCEQKSEIDPYSLPVSDDSSLPTFDESIYHPCTEKAYEQKPSDEEMKTLLRTEYEKGRADAIEEMQNFAWSEEDSVMLGLCVDAASGYYNPDNKEKMKGWLYSIKDRVQPKQEWIEDTQQWIDAIIRDYEEWYDADIDHRATIQIKINILKSLRPQPQWKPSDKQMKALGIATNISNVPEKEYLELEKLYQDLEKLKGE